MTELVHVPAPGEVAQPDAVVSMELRGSGEGARHHRPRRSVVVVIESQRASQGSRRDEDGSVLNGRSAEGRVADREGAG